MDLKEFKKAGHWPTLLGAFLYFDFSFMVWVMLGALGVVIAQDLGLNPSQKGLMVALPVSLALRKKAPTTCCAITTVSSRVPSVAVVQK